MIYPDQIEIQPLTKPPKATIQVPGSKSITNRALILAALSDPSKGSQLRGVLQSEDTEVMVEALKALGFRMQTDRRNATIQVWGDAIRRVPAEKADLFAANSGTSMRFLTALVCLGHGRYRLDGVARMRERPINDLLSALQQLGVKASSERDNGFPPVVVEAHGIPGGRARIRADISSQFLSALLMAAPFAKTEVIIETDGPFVSQPYIRMTLELMKQFGAAVEVDSMRLFRVPSRSCYRSLVLDIEPDASAASYFYAAAAITEGEIRVAGLNALSLQGDIAFINILNEMGCVTRGKEPEFALKKRKSNADLLPSPDICVRGFGLHGIDADMNDISDCVMTLAAVACFAEGPTTIRNVAHIRHKETDRLHALATELRRVGAEVDEFPDGLKITPRPLHGAVIETYNDHRMAMSMALIGLKVPGIVIKNPACVAKTYPNFFEDLERLR